MHLRLTTSDALVPQQCEKKVLQAWSEALLVYEAASNASDDATKTAAALLFVLFPSAVLRPGSSNKQIIDRSERFLGGEFAELIHEAMLAQDASLALRASKKHDAKVKADLKRLDEPDDDDGTRLDSPWHDMCERRAMFHMRKGEIGRACAAIERSSSPPPPRGADFEDKLKALHPPCSTGTDAEGNPVLSASVKDTPIVPDADRIRFEVEDLRRVLRKLRNGVCPGSSCCRYEHLKVFLSDHDAIYLRPLLEDLVNGTIPNELAALLGNSDLVAITKGDGSPRPIALLETIRNVAGNLLLSRCMPGLRTKFHGLQFAVGSKGGVEIAIHGFRTIITQETSWASLLVDFRNMFNEISRDGVLDAVRRHCPLAFPFIHRFYSRSANVSFRSEDGSMDDFFLMCEQGVFQGDTWGSVAACCLLLDFQLALNDALALADVEAVQFAIADDLTILGSPKAVQVAWDFIATWAPASGCAPEPYALKVKVPKCKLFSFATQATLENWFTGSIPITVERISGQRSDGGVRFLGSPVGHDVFCKDSCRHLVEVEFQKRREAICSLKDTQSALLLLRYCHVSRFAFTLRTTPPPLVYEAAKLMDAGTRVALDLLLGLKGNNVLSDLQWSQCMLPIAQAGLGLYSSFESCVPAFAGSVGLCLHRLANLETSWPRELTGIFSGLGDISAPGNKSVGQEFLLEALSLAEAVYEDNLVAIEALKPHYVQPATVATPPPTPYVFPDVALLLSTTVHQLQKAVSRCATQVEFHRLLAHPDTSPKDTCRLLSASGPMAGGWLTASPVRADLCLNPSECVDACRYRLNVPLINVSRLADTSILCACGKHHCPSDPDSLNCCSKACGIYRIRRHDAVKFKVGSIAKTAGHAVKYEQRVCPDGVHYRTDLSIEDYVSANRNGTYDTSVRVRAHLDFAVTDPTGKTNVSKARIQGISANKYAARKEKGEGAARIRTPDVFIPAIMETYGLAHIAFRKLLHSIAETHLIQSASGVGFSDEQYSMLKGIVVNGYYQLISVAAVKGVVNCLDRAAQRILAGHGRKAGRGPPMTHARAECLIGSSIRAASSGLAEFG
jgi:hypothetical protein